MMTAQDVMTRKVTTIAETAETAVLARLFVDSGFGTLPVVDADGALCGMISETDLLQQEAPVHIPRVTALFDWVFYLESEKSFQEQVRKITARKVADLCTREVITCAPATPLPELAALMTRHRIHLIPVVEERKILGVVARVDLLRAMES
jgi:CBS-domain-containing membrane protein